MRIREESGHSGYVTDGLANDSMQFWKHSSHELWGGEIVRHKELKGEQ